MLTELIIGGGTSGQQQQQKQQQQQQKQQCAGYPIPVVDCAIASAVATAAG